MATVMKKLTTCLTLLLLSECLFLRATAWTNAHATFYGGANAMGTNNGACGYSNVFALGYGTMTAALSAPLFRDGDACGACYQIRCVGDPSCYSNSIVVTATNLCPQGSDGGWCDSPKEHFDLSQPAFAQIAKPVAGHVTVSYERVNCNRQGGIRFQIDGHTYFMQVLLYNVGGSGDVQSVQVKGTNTEWITMTRGWGATWQTGTVLDGQALSFAVKTGDGKTLYTNNVASSSWRYGQTYEGSQF
ncbi:hypothetical protein R1flu_021334 [Riccia fluitans]|uniref:Expansin n=1 Tax=Riccia fluitans TaxID=41844 RepID=A0ABD1ZP38_9MARC